MNARPARSTAAHWRAPLGNALALGLLLALALAMLPLHDDAWWPASPRARDWWLAAGSLAAYAGACAWLASRRRTRAGPAPAAGARLPWLVVHASQTGFAVELAGHTADALRAAGAEAALHPLSSIDAELLSRSERALFVVSTTGEGDPPDPALGFVRDTMGRDAALPGLRYAVLALGDREYGHFCAFGHRLAQWLHHRGATPLFDVIEVDNGDPGALRHWQHHLALAAGARDMPDWVQPRYERWTLAARVPLNPGSLGGPAYLLSLQPPAGTAPQWSAGDIAEIGPRNALAAVDAVLAARGLDGDATVDFLARPVPLREALAQARLESLAPSRDPQVVADALQPLPHREYSIASLPGDGRLELLVRQATRDDGTPGLGSGWLCLDAGIGAGIDLRIRANPGFHPPRDARPLLLVGNGTGIAGLRALLKAREAAGHGGRNWLLFGERQRAHDAFFIDDVERWRRDGLLARADLVFSRDGGAHRYVQDALRAAAPALREWIGAGADVCVCGSLEGMAPGVDAVLREALGDDVVDALREDGRYRRDVY